MKTTIENPQVYVGTYSKYNNGSLFGEWVDLTRFSDKDEFLDYCKELHSDEEDPEFMFQDFEGIPEQLISESHISENFWPLYEALNDLSTDEKKAFEHWLDNGHDLNDDASTLIDEFRDSYCGNYSNGLEEYAEQMVDEGIFGNIPESIANYIDYSAIARDLGYDGYWSVDGHVFRPN